MHTLLTTRHNSRLFQIQCLSGNQLKMIAAICMLVDHLTKVFYTSAAYRIINPMIDSGQLSADQLRVIHGIYDPILCGIGAIAFPVFAFLFAEGFCHTQSKSRYCLRLAIVALLSEFPFDATFYGRYREGTAGWPWYWYHQNVFFTYLLALCALWLLEECNSKVKPKSKLMCYVLQGSAILAVLCLTEFVVYGDYGVYGVFLIIVTYALRKNRLYQIAGMLIVKLLFERSYYPFSFLLSLIFILLYNNKRGEKNLKPFFYAFYPLHIALIGLLDWLLFTRLWETLGLI